METVRMENGYKNFRNYTVLNNVSFVCNSGEITGFVGENGSGKSVIFKCLCGFYQLDRGEIYINGKRRENAYETLHNAGIMIEAPAFIEQYSGLKNLELLYCIENKPDRKHLIDIMKLVGLNPENRTRVGRYSMGMKQRLAIAQMIMEEKEIYIFDEPMNGLDKQGVVEIRNLIKNLKEQGKTILLASHNKEDIHILCDRVYELDNGIMQEQI